MRYTYVGILSYLLNLIIMLLLYLLCTGNEKYGYEKIGEGRTNNQICVRN